MLSIQAAEVQNAYCIVSLRLALQVPRLAHTNTHTHARKPTRPPTHTYTHQTTRVHTYSQRLSSWQVHAKASMLIQSITHSFAVSREIKVQSYPCLLTNSLKSKQCLCCHTSSSLRLSVDSTAALSAVNCMLFLLNCSACSTHYSWLAAITYTRTMHTCELTANAHSQ